MTSLTSSFKFDALQRCLRLFFWRKEGRLFPLSFFSGGKGRRQMTGRESPGQSMRPLLFSLEAEGQVAKQTIVDLRGFAQEMNFLFVSDLYHLRGEEVKPGANLHEDHLRDLKLDSIMTIKFEDKVVGVFPVEIFAFTCVLMNGQSLNIGLCKYPENIELSNGFIIKIDDSNWHWNSYVFSSLKSRNKDSCKSVVKILTRAKDLGILTDFKDSNFKRIPLEASCNNYSSSK